MPELHEMVCKECQEVRTKDELEPNDGYCDACALGRCVVCRDKVLTPEQIDDGIVICGPCDEATSKGTGEGEELPNVDELTKEELAALKAYRKHQEFMKEYNQRPHVKARRAEYTKGYNKKKAEAIRKLQAMGIIESKRKPS